MSIYFVAQWSFPEVKKEACEEAIKAALAHIQAEHPAIRSVRVFRQVWGPLRTTVRRGLGSDLCSGSGLISGSHCFP